MSAAASGADPPQVEDRAICVLGGGGLLLPLFGDSEQGWPRGLRIVLYLLGLLWCFMGVSIVADVFMTAIEKVTSKKIRIFDKKTQRYRTYELWNATIANLTLMALGSSAPEILLNVIDIFAKEFFLEGLGPSTIVGSAAFNLLMIIAVCIVSIPSGDVRYIKDLTVYACTASWSIFAYLWLIVILLLISPHVVEVWEGVLTFCFFPLMALSAFACDKGWIGGGGGATERKPCICEGMTTDELAEAYMDVRRRHGSQITDDQVARILIATSNNPRSRARYRVAAMRAVYGGNKGKTVEYGRGNSSSNFRMLSLRKVVPSAPEEEEQATGPETVFQLPATRLAVLESGGSVQVAVRRGGDVSFPAEVRYETVAGTAEAGRDFEVAAGWLAFEAGAEEKSVDVVIKDDDEAERDGDFFFRLHEARCLGGGRATVDPSACEAQVTIVDDDDAGELSFDNDGDELSIRQRPTDFVVNVRVRRVKGASGEIRVRYYAEGDTAIPERDFDPCEGVLVFSKGQVDAAIDLCIKGASRFDVSDRFRLVLADPEQGAKLDADRDGGPELNILTVTILPDCETRERVERIQSALARRWQKSKVGHANWASQFKDAISIDTADGDGGLGRKIHNYFVYCLTMPWKLLFACVPPTDFCGGWLCFWCALIGIGFVTMIINDMASLLGCVLCIPDEITAITFVALGTSLPDTFASMASAKSELHADSSVGNVTGSNSVNVFLGLGLPWMIAALAWSGGGSGNARWQSRYQLDPELGWLGLSGFREQAFVVKAGSLAFSVTVFTICAILCLLLLALRRRFCGGELGGSKGGKWTSAFLLASMWFLYIGLSSWKSLAEAGGGSCAK